MARTILLADDSPTIRKIVELTLSDTGFRVVSVGTGREALEHLEALEPDLVLADVVMPEPSGYEVCRQVKASPRPVPVLLLAGTFEPFDVGAAKACGADGHLLKPFESRLLRDRVGELLADSGTSEAPTVSAEFPAPAEPSDDEELKTAEDRDAAPSEGEPTAAAGVSPTQPPGPQAEGETPSKPHRLRVAAEDGSDRTGGPAEPLELPVRVVEGAVSRSAPAATRAADPRGQSAPEDEPDPRFVEAVARAVVKRLSTATLREIAWEVVPDLASEIIRERIRELEQEDPEQL